MRTCPHSYFHILSTSLHLYLFAPQFSQMHVSTWHSLMLTPDALMICRLAYTPTLLHCGLASSLKNMRLTVVGRNLLQFIFGSISLKRCHIKCIQTESGICC